MKVKYVGFGGYMEVPCYEDENGNGKATYSTFKRIAEGIWEYCGDCFRGENVKRGTELPYVR